MFEVIGLDEKSPGLCRSLAVGIIAKKEQEHGKAKERRADEGYFEFELKSPLTIR